MSQVDRLVEAVDAMERRLEGVSTFLRGLDEGGTAGGEALAKAIHDCANVQQSMGALRRLVKRMEPREG